MIGPMRRLLKHAFGSSDVDDHAYYRLVRVDKNKEQVVFQVKNKFLLITCSYAEAVGDPGIVNHLSPNEACYLGGYYARALRSEFGKSKGIKKARSKPFLLKKKGGKYQILFQSRSGEVGYINRDTREEFIDNPVALANNKYLISQFNSCQACYIGIMAGISFEKNVEPKKQKGESVDFRPVLRVVK